MRLRDKVNNKMKDMVRKWLDIRPAGQRQVVITEPLSFETNVMRNLIWYRGEAEELEQLSQWLSAHPSDLTLADLQARAAKK